jgi:outer membrane protein OmpA-like peptidoglycan-associated protein
MRTTGVGIGLAAVVAMAVTPAGQARRPPSGRLNFLACPVVRDTATLPCWLAEHDGELYFLGTQGSTSSAFYPPQLLHEVLVEAAVGTGPRVCGGLPLVSVEVSVMPEINRACNTVLPAEPGYSTPPSPPAPIPSFSDTTREFVVAYDFDSDYLTLHTTRVILEAVRVSRAAGTTRVSVHGARTASLLSDGRVLTERPTMGEVRARKVTEALIGLGIPAAAISMTWQTSPATPDGATDVARRRVTIRLE